MNELRKIDAIGSRRPPYGRHLATINRIRVPGFKRTPGEPGDTLDGEIAATRCGRFIRQFRTADDVSLRDTEGGVYAEECPRCFEKGNKTDGR